MLRFAGEYESCSPLNILRLPLAQLRAANAGIHSELPQDELNGYSHGR